MEEFQQITEDPLVHCPNCKTDNLARIMGTGVGLIFKGSGFYQTDYKKESPKKDSSPKEGEKKPSKPDAGTKPPDSTEKK
jgi:putative FmdB family regulatory protein